MSAILKFIRENHILALIEQAIVKKKSTLSLNAFEISDIPSLLYTCVDVQHLYLHRNKITIVSVQLTQLVNLTTLTLDYNNISTLPPEIGNLKNLVNLNISYNPLQVLVPEIGNLENLEAFWCNRIGLQEIPKEIGKLSKLDTFGARGNELNALPAEITKLTRLRWLTLEHNRIEILPCYMHRLESLVHCNLRSNRIREFPMDLLHCEDLMFLLLNGNLISSLPDEWGACALPAMEVVDLRDNPICELDHPEHPLLRYMERPPPVPPSQELTPQASSASRGLGLTATAVRLQPANPAQPPAEEPPVEIDVDSSSLGSSEDWENSVNSSELDVQYQSDEERAENEAVGMVLPELSRFASTAS